MTAPPFLRPKPSPLRGIALKEAELITHRILSFEVPIYEVLPIPPAEQVALYAFLCGPGFASLPSSLDPASPGITPRNNRPYGVPGARAERKRQQIANMVTAVATLTPSIKRKGRGLNSPRAIADFCGGCGHVGLVLAKLFPSWIVCIIDAKASAIAVARKRAAEANLQNIRFFEGDLNTFERSFDIGVALHACGGASDAVIAKCVSNGAALAIAPCCVGGVVSKKGSVTGFGSGARIADFVNEGNDIDFTVARSKEFRERLTSAEYVALARAADYGESASYDPWRKVAKSLVEADRCAWMQEANYDSVLIKMRPESCTPKNDIIVAFPNASVKVKWDLDTLANSFVAAVRNGNALHAFPEHKIAPIERRLRAMVLADGAPGEVVFPCARGAQERKLIHSVAESLQLQHESFGRGAGRRVRVKRSLHWPLYREHYVGLGGAAVQRLGEKLSWHVPEDARHQRKQARGKAFHITIVAPNEVRELRWNGRIASLNELLDFVGQRVEGTQFSVPGVGMCMRDDRVAYYGIVEWEAATRCRAELGLFEEGLHVTLGFVGKDIHGVDKGTNTMIVEEAHQCSPWGS